MKKTITLFVFAVMCIVGTTNAQKAQSTPIEELLNRIELIGDTPGSISEYFTQAEQIQLKNYFANASKTTKTFTGINTTSSGDNSFVDENPAGGTSVNFGPAGTVTGEKGANIVITHSNSQTIEPGAGIACASSTFTNNWVYRDFDLAGDFGITDDFVVTHAEIAISDGVVAPNGSFPMTVNIYSTVPGTFPGGTLTLQGTSTVDVTVADDLTLMSIPVDATIAYGDAMILEVVLYDDGLSYMRWGCNLEGQTGPSYIMAPDCGANVPTPLSDFGLDNSFVFNVVGDEGGGGTSSTVYCSMNVTAEFGSFDITDGSLPVAIGPSPITNFEASGAVDSADAASAYVMDNVGNFYHVDVATGTYTFIDNSGFADVTGMEFDSATGTLYAVSLDNLWMIDKTTGAATSVGALGMAGGAIALAIDGAGNGWAYDIYDDTFYHVDLGTGAATPIGYIGFDCSYGQGMFWDPGTDTVYMTAFNVTLFDSEYRTVDTATGATTLLTQMDAANLTQYAWSSIGGDGPEPPSCMVLEDFDAGLPAGWSTVINTGTCDWSNGADMPTGDDFPTPAMFFDDDACGSGADPSNVTLLSDVYDTESATYLTLTYDVGFQEAGDQTFVVEVYDGAAWVQVAFYDADLDPDIQTATMDVTAYANANFQVAYTYDDGANWGWYAAVDNFCLDYEIDIPVLECTGEDVAVDFEAGLPADWSTVVNSGDCDWVNQSETPTGDQFPTLAMVFDDDACGSGATPSNASLYSGVYNTTNATYLTVGYDIGFQSYDGVESFTIEAYDGAAWQQIGYYNDDLDPDIQIIAMDALAYSNANFQVRFTYDDGGTWGWYAGVDNFCLDTDGAVGVSENVIEGFGFYPNPANETINLSAQNNIENVVIYDILGQKVVDVNINATTSQVNVSNLSTGAYIMKVAVDGQVGSYKFIKN